MSRRKSLCCAEAAECVVDPAELKIGPDRAGDWPSVDGGAMVESRLSSGTSSGMFTLLVGNFDAAFSRVVFDCSTGWHMSFGREGALLAFIIAFNSNTRQLC